MAESGIHWVERELDRIFANLGHGMYVVDNERRILLWNRAAESILGWSEQDMLGRSCRDFIGHVDDQGKQLCDEGCPLLATMRESRAVFAGTVWGMSKSGKRVPLNVSCAPLFDDDGSLVGAVEVFSDMTHEKEVENFKDSMVSVVAHELRTPLTSIKGYLELLTGGDLGEVTGEQHEFLDIVQSNVARLEELVNDLLDIGRLESGRVVVHWEPMDLEAMVKEVVDSYRPLALKRGLAIECRFGMTLPVRGDYQLFRRVVFILVSNAIKYTNQGLVTVRLGREGERVFVEVTDTGVGIPEAELDNVRKKFFRASTASQTGSTGSGLGLAIAGDIIEKHGGELELESSVGKGSKFRVLLPAAEETTILEILQGGSDGG